MLSIDGTERKKRSLQDILNGPDVLGLLDVEVKRKSGASSGLAGYTGFEEVNAFIDTNNRMPDMESSNLDEKLLGRRANSYINEPKRYVQLKSYDRHGLFDRKKTNQVVLAQEDDFQLSNHDQLDVNNIIKAPIEKPKPKEVTSLADIFKSSLFADFTEDREGLFDVSGLAPSTAEDKNKPDMIGQQKPCKDFYRFEDAFAGWHAKLKSGEVKTIRFRNESQIRENDAFILEGVLCFIEKIGKYRTDNDGRYDPRLRLIFENHTESNILLRSFGKRLYTDKTGRRIVRDAESVVDDFNNTERKAVRTGQIYIVKTKSDNPVLTAVPNLFKIGFTKNTVEERAKNAERDIAFLEAPIEVMARADCFDLDPRSLESLVHGFLYAQRLQITLKSKNGSTYKPKEWFSVSLEDAKEIILRIADNTIVQYRMDNTTNRLVKKSL